jgi:Tol biopolymer transport system component
MLIRLSSRQTLAEVPLAGGEPREVLENVSGADWDPEGKSFAVIRSVGGHHRVEYPVGKVLYETQLAWPPMYARFSPKGDLLAFFDRTEVGDYSLTIVGPDHPRQVLSVGWRAIAGLGWSPDGREVWFSGGRTGTDPAVYAVNFSGRERMLVQIPGWASLYDIGSDGRFLLSNIDSRIGIRCLAPASRDERNLGWLDASLVQAISNDGKLILFNELASGEGRNTAIYLRRTDGSPAVRLGFGNQPALSPDCKSVLCIRREGNASQLVLLPTGPGEARTLPESGIRPLTAEWFPDGKQILITGMQANQPVRTYVKNLATGANRPVTAPGVTASGISPDGRLAVAMSPAGKVVLLSVDTGSETGVGVVDPGVSVIRWSGEGRYLFLKRVTGNRLAILRLDVRTGQTQVWRELKPFDAMASFFESVKLSADGSAYAYSFQRDSAILYLVTGVQ